MTTPPHIPVAGVQCSNWHSNTAASFAAYSMGVTGHTAVSASRCDSCHNGSFTGEGTKGAQGTASFPGHVATNGKDCVTCHTSASSAFASWVGGTFTHAATDTNCSSCHNGTTATGMKTPPHIPVTGVQCSSCHTNTAASFTTYAMGVPGHAAVNASRCDSCHNGSFTGEGTSGALGTASFPGHVAPNGKDCVTCHASAASAFTSWTGGTFTHAATDTNCSNCHNGTTATGLKTPPHIPVTGVQCSNCHTNTAASFTIYTMGVTGHTAVNAGRCDSCHNGSFTGEGTKGAQGTASFPGHVATNGNDCVTCHASAATTFASWTGGTFVHAATDTNCSSCHNGTTATGLKTPPHIPVTGIQCSNCHTNTAASFVTYAMGATGHAAVSASRCDSCHNGSFTGEGTKGAQGTA
ncbi:MAG: multiheme c-type cytochrome, partial [Mycobacterium sp.]|nr:multiheme c-type cytochrome [Mycobacterium sp.]